MLANSARKIDPVAVNQMLKDDAYEGMTSKQQLFATLSFSGLNDTEAYRQAFDVSEPSAHAVQQTAHNPLVVAKIKRLLAERDANSTLAPWLTKNWILNGIADLARFADKDSVKLSAFVALGKTAGIDLFRETVRHETVSRTVEDVEQELKDKLEQLRQGLTIDGKSRHIDAPAPSRKRKPKPA